MPKRRALTVLALLVGLLLLLAGGAAWWASSSRESRAPEEPLPAASASARTHRRVRDTPATEPVARSQDPEQRAATRGDPSKVAYERLRDALAAGTLTDEMRDALLADAGKGKLPAGGLHEILRRATEESATSIDPGARDRARAVAEWTVDEALRPYREDRALFAATYRKVRFGEGKLDAPGGSLVREMKFREAAEAMEAIRPRLQTWCYEVLALRVASAFREDQSYWSAGRWSTPSGMQTLPAAGSQEAATLTPAQIAAAYVTPNLGAGGSIDWYVGMGRAFTDLGESDVATALLAKAREAIEQLDPRTVKWFRRWIANALALDAEIAALRDLRDAAGWRVPAEAGGPPELTAWFARHRPTDLAHAIGAGGDVELGPWDDTMTKSWLDGGLVWAPEQWQAERAWLAQASETQLDGIRGWTVPSAVWETFTDVSPEFAAEAAMVLESAWVQGQIAVGRTARPWRPIGARIYSRRAAYEDTVHNKFRGCWSSTQNAMFTFLDDPNRTDFDDFHWPTLAHEATHAVLAYALGRDPPEWINEGLACYVQRWDPTRSIAVNQALTRDWVDCARTLEVVRDAGQIPTLDQFARLQSVPEFAIEDDRAATHRNYALAESLFVHLGSDLERWKIVGSWLDAVRAGRDPSPIPAPPKRDELEKGWRDFIEFSCGRLRGAK